MATDNGNGTVTVVKGDNLSSIAKKYYQTYGYSNWTSYMNHLVEINNIANANVIGVGQVIKLTSSASGGSSSGGNSTVSSMVTIVRGPMLLSTSSDTLYIQWEWAKHDETEKYEVQWYRSWALQGIALNVVQSTTNLYDTYTVPSEVVNDNNGKVSVRIRPIAKTKTDADGKSYTPWTASWTSTWDAIYNFGDSKPAEKPPAPSVEIEDLKLTVTLDSVPEYIEQVEFQVARNNSSTIYRASGPLNAYTSYVEYKCDIESGSAYKARARYLNNGTPGEWSNWSSNSGTRPNTPLGFTDCHVKDETSVYLEWNAVDNATSYEIGYTTEKDYFDIDGKVSTVTTTMTKHIVSDLATGAKYFFAYRAVNAYGKSGWSDLFSRVVGTTPAAPTTWSTVTEAVIGETCTLYWVHNSEDGSTQNKVYIEIIVDGVTKSIEIDTSEQKDDEKTTWYPLVLTMDGATSLTQTGATLNVDLGATILWRVKTAGVTDTYSEWSVQRTITVYAQPTVSINVLDYSGEEVSVIRQFPIYIKASAGPSTQKPVGYYLSVVSNDYYETLDNTGRRKVVNSGEEIYSEYLDTSSYAPAFTLSADNIDLENDAFYTVKCVVSMDSGLSGEDVRYFNVAWTDKQYEPNAEIRFDKDNLTASIRPYCKNENGALLGDVTLSVYRREFDGSFTEIMTGMNNLRNTYATDPHPALDYARYRIVAISTTTGAVSYYDMPGYRVGEKSVVIQWNEEWSDFDVVDGYATQQTAWTGSMLKLPYNIDVSDNHAPDVSLIEYVGRKYPVTYYGTQVGHTSSWSVDIPKTDVETLYAIRRLANWMGDVYVREPSGSGYWANVTVSYSQTHLETVIPVKLNVKRVSGGA